MADRVLRHLSRVFFITIVALFFLFSTALVIIALWDVSQAALAQQEMLGTMLRSIGLLTVSLAVFEVGKFLAEEELMRERELGSVREARYSLTKFITLIIIVISIESIVFLFEAKTRNESFLHPALLLLTAIVALLALGLFQRLTRAAEKGSGGD